MAESKPSCTVCQASGATGIFEKIDQYVKGQAQNRDDYDETNSEFMCSSCGLCLNQNQDGVESELSDVFEDDMSYIRWEPMRCPISCCGNVIGKSAFAMHYFEQECTVSPPVKTKLGKKL